MRISHDVYDAADKREPCFDDEENFDMVVFLDGQAYGMKDGSDEGTLLTGDPMA